MITHQNHPESHIAAYWRIAAIVAVGLYALMAVSVLRFVVLNPLMSVIFMLTIVWLGYAGWLIFSGRGRVLAAGYALLVVGCAGLLLELSAFADSSSARGLVAFAVMAVTYLLIIGVLRQQYWQEQRVLGEHRANPLANASPAAATQQLFKQPVLIINPKSGDGRAVKAHIDTLARQQGIEVIFTQPEKDVATTAEEAVLGGADVLGVSGGDGSIGAVARIAIEYNVPVVVLPGGTRCHFARDLGMDPKRIVDALAAFHGVERKVDVGCINGRVFLNNASFGLYADIVDHPDYREHKLKIGQQVLQEIASGDKSPYALEFTLDEKKYEQAVQVLVAVNRYETFNLLEPLRRSRLDEGVLQVTVVESLNNELVRRLLRGAATKSIKNIPGLYQTDVASLEIGTDGTKLVAGVDGENETYDAPVSLYVLPKALRVYVPAEGVRSRPMNAFSRKTVRSIWETGLSGRSPVKK